MAAYNSREGRRGRRRRSARRYLRLDVALSRYIRDFPRGTSALVRYSGVFGRYIDLRFAGASVLNRPDAFPLLHTPFSFFSPVSSPSVSSPLSLPLFVFCPNGSFLLRRPLYFYFQVLPRAWTKLFSISFISLGSEVLLLLLSVLFLPPSLAIFVFFVVPSYSAACSPSSILRLVAGVFNPGGSSACQRFGPAA